MLTSIPTIYKFPFLTCIFLLEIPKRTRKSTSISIYFPLLISFTYTITKKGSSHTYLKGPHNLFFLPTQLLLYTCTRSIRLVTRHSKKHTCIYTIQNDQIWFDIPLVVVAITKIHDHVLRLCDLSQGRDAMVTPIPVEAIKSLDTNGGAATKVSTNESTFPSGRWGWSEPWWGREGSWRNRGESLIPEQRILN